MINVCQVRRVAKIKVGALRLAAAIGLMQIKPDADI